MSTAYRPLTPDAVIDVIAGRVAARRGTMRVAVDGAPATGAHTVAAALVEPLRVLGRAVANVSAESFWHDASLRFEYGHEDVDSFATWLDAAALRREVLDPAVTAARYLPTLRDPVTNRATRDLARPVPPGAVVVVSGALLLGRDLPFDLTVHLSMSPGALARRTEAALAWTLPAYARYETEVRPTEIADIVIRLDDPRHPAVRLP